MLVPPRMEITRVVAGEAGAVDKDEVAPRTAVDRTKVVEGHKPVEDRTSGLFRGGHLVGN